MKVLRVLKWIALGYITISALRTAEYEGIVPAISVAVVYLFFFGVVSLIIWCVMRVDRWVRRKLHGSPSTTAEPPSI